MINQPKFKLTDPVPADSGTDNESKRYEIRQFVNTGWELNDENDTNLTKEQCDIRLEEYTNDGIPSNRIKVIRVI